MFTHKSSHKFITSTLLLWVLSFSTQVFAALDNQGKEFFISFLPNISGNADTLQLHLTAKVETDISIEYPVNSPTFTKTVSVTPGEITAVDLPLSADNWSSGNISDNTVRAFSDNEFVAYSVNLRTYTSDAALALPVDTMNTDYVVATYRPSSGSQFIVYAAYDNTKVTITSSVSTSATSAGIPFTLTLNRGEAYYLKGNRSGAAGDLSGTIIEADRPVGVVNGNNCTNVPNNTGACDSIYEVAQPTQSWGKKVLTANLPKRPSGSIYRVFASSNNTEVTLDNGLLGNINRGEFIETNVLPGSHVFEGDNPIFVVQFMTGQNYPNAVSGDPAMGNMIPAEQYQRQYTFSTVGDGQFASQYLTVIANDLDVGQVLLDGTPIAASAFNAIGTSGFSSAVIELSEGVHTTSSPELSDFGHGITVEGYNNYDSFIFPGGALFQFIDPTGDANPPLCTLSETGVGRATDQRPSEDVNGNEVLDGGEDLNGNGIIDEDTGIFFVELIASDNTALAVDPFTPADGSVNFTVSHVSEKESGSATVKVTDGAGNTCKAHVSFSAIAPMMCDIDDDSDVDMNDILAIRSARNTPAYENDPMDIDLDEMITLNDARMCVVQCTRQQCATE